MISSLHVSDERLVDGYLRARNAVVRAGYSHEVEWQERVDLARLSEQAFLREAAWVVLASGMRELIIRRKFPAVSEAFKWWQSAIAIVHNARSCRSRAMRVFGHAGKICAIITIADVVSRYGFANVRQSLVENGTEFIESLPYMGPATSLHLAKNIGLQVAKPDRHLCRLAAAAGYETPKDMCGRIARYVNDPIPVIDIVLWRFATLSSRNSVHCWVGVR